MAVSFCRSLSFYPTIISRFGAGFNYGTIASRTGTPLKWAGVNLRSGMRYMSGSLAQFEQAQKQLGSLKEDPGNEVKLQLYGLFKQATVGKCNSPKPGMMDFVGKAKWEAWNKLGDISKEQAQADYAKIVCNLAGSQTDKTPAQTGQYETILYEVIGKAAKLTFNRPTKKNAINVKMYEELATAISMAASDPNVTVLLTTGSGEYYCSGNDLSNFTLMGSDIPSMAKNAAVILEQFVGVFIDFPKPLIAAINGPVIGIPCTVLGLYDAVYASDRANFRTPFSTLGQSPEGCASYTFPRIMGPLHARDILMLNKVLSAEEAQRRGLVTEVIGHDVFQKTIDERLQSISQLPPKTMRAIKNLVRDDKEVLWNVNKRECELLQKLWQADECMNAVAKFLSKGK